MPDGCSIAFFGSSLVSAYWNGAATYYRGIIRELHQRGHRITFFEPDAFQRQEHRDIDDPDYARSVVYPATSEKDVLPKLRESQDFDVVIKTSGIGVFDDYLAAAVLEHRRPGKLAIYWDVDAPATLDELENDPDHPLHESIPEYDAIFTYGGGDPVVRRYLALGAQRCVPIYNALDPTTHYRVGADPRFGFTLGFLGNRMPDREERVHEFFFNPARMLKDKSFVLGGSGWETSVPDLSNIRYCGHVYTRDHNAFYSGPLAILNVNRQSMARSGYSPATRIFEAAGAASCVITDDWVGLDQFLTPGVECLSARDGEDVADQLSKLTPERAREIGNAAQTRVLRDHVYSRRAADVDHQLSQLFSPEVLAR